MCILQEKREKAKEPYHDRKKTSTTLLAKIKRNIFFFRFYLDADVSNILWTKYFIVLHMMAHDCTVHPSSSGSNRLNSNNKNNKTAEHNFSRRDVSWCLIRFFFYYSFISHVTTSSGWTWEHIRFKRNNLSASATTKAIKSTIQNATATAGRIGGVRRGDDTRRCHHQWNLIAHTLIEVSGKQQSNINTTHPNCLSARTNFVRFNLQIERELVLSSDKASSKIPLMREARTPSGQRRTVGIPLLPRQTGAIAPDHPPKQMHAWVRITQISIFIYLVVKSDTKKCHKRIRGHV